MNQLILGDNLESLKELVELFSNNIEVYNSNKYDESNTRNDFIDKFFALLGWDVYNSIGASEDFREVIREDKVVIEGRPKSPDYFFKIGRERQFFVEAKKPAVNIFHDIHTAFQLRRYAYTAGLSISILTNFEEFAIYDTNIKPKETDNASVARIFYCKYTDYIKNWDFLKETISKQAVLQGKLKKYAVDNKGKKGIQTVDKELLLLIETWRFALAKNIALRNKEIDIYKLNEAVQIIIDRIIFLRMAEDRNTEEYGKLQKFAGIKDLYPLLVKYFDSSNKKYNSGLFATVNWLDNLAIDDKIFKSIINCLYYPVPYEFSVLPIEILGQIYEQFLGKTITLSNKHVADVIEKPEVRKAGGVYYTPKYIVDYIVENTVGKKIENKAPKDIESLTILDPACGSGSFLVGAYKFLLNYHIEYYTNNGNINKALKEGRIYSAGEKDYRLTIREKKKILLNNIYGVDIDSQAVEVTKLSLLLTLMEGEIVESRGELFLKSISEALLPNLNKNIKCGNSLIGTDFYNDKDLTIFDISQQRKINCFDWEEEFPYIFKGRKEKFDKNYLELKLKKGLEKSKEAIEIAGEAYKHTYEAYEYAKKYDIVSEPVVEYKANFEYFGKGGFDIVIGNPPYVLIQELDNNRPLSDYFLSYYRSAQYKVDLYHLFIEKGINLLKQDGMISFITPNTYLLNKYNDKLRKYILDNVYINEFVIHNNKVFEAASVNTSVFSFTKRTFSNNYISIQNHNTNQKYFINQDDFLTNTLYSFNIHNPKNNFNWEKRILKDIIKFGEIGDAYFGIQTYDRKVYVSKNKLDKNFKQIIDGGDFAKYNLAPRNEYVNFIPEAIKSGGNLHIYEQDKIVVRQIGKFPIATLDTQKFYSLNTIYNLTLKPDIIYDLRYILGIINSKLMVYYWLNKFYDNKPTFPKIKKIELHSLPIRIINFTNKSEKAQHDRMVSLVEQMLSAQKEAHSDDSITETDKKLINQRIKIIDKQIDSLVYEMYGLTNEEIKIVESE